MLKHLKNLLVLLLLCLYASPSSAACPAMERARKAATKEEDNCLTECNSCSEGCRKRFSMIRKIERASCIRKCEATGKKCNQNLPPVSEEHKALYKTQQSITESHAKAEKERRARAAARGGGGVGIG